MKSSSDYLRRLDRQIGHIKRFSLRQIEDIRFSGKVVICRKVRTAICFHLPNAITRILLLPWALVGVFIIRCLRPFVTIRISPMNVTRVGHLLLDIEMMLTEDDFLRRSDERFTVDLWYPWQGRLGISNKYVLDIWKRELNVLPRLLLEPVDSMNRLLPGGTANMFPYRKGIPNQMGQHHDIYGARREIRPHFKLNAEDINAGMKAAEELGIAPNDRLVCLQVRDRAYLRSQTGQDWFDDIERNASIDDYARAVEILTESGYKVIRMGVIAEKRLCGSWPDEMVVDLPFSDSRTELIDLYLGSKCEFFVTTGSGIDAIAHVFRLPLVYTNMSDFSRDLFLTHETISIFRRPFDLQSGRLISLEEFFRAKFHERRPSQLSSEGIGFLDNTVEEIAGVCTEAMEAIQIGFEAFLTSVSKSDSQKEVLGIFPSWLKSGGVRGLISPSFLRQHTYLLE